MSFRQGTFGCDLRCDQCWGISNSGQRCKRITCARLPTCFQHTRTMFGVDIRPSRHGMGMFALKSFDKDELVAPYIGEKISDNELDKRYGDDVAPYAINIGGGQTLDAACTRGLGSYANDYRTDPKDHKKNKASMNAELSDETSTEFGGVWVKAIKKIAPGQEVLVDYGKEYWSGEHPPHQTLKRKLYKRKPYSRSDADADFQRAMEAHPGGPSAFRLPKGPQSSAGPSTNKVKLLNILDVYKKSTGGPTVTAKDAEDTCREVYSVFRRISGGADGAVGHGLNGSLSYPSMCTVLRALGVGASTILVDIGAAEGRALACAAALGARRVIGYELPHTAPNHERFFNPVMDKLGLPAERQYIHRDISTVDLLPTGTTCVYSFWVGFDPDVKDHIIRLIAQCPTARSACVFLVRRDHTVQELTEGLEAFGKVCKSSSVIKVKMFGSGEQKSAVVFNF